MKVAFYKAKGNAMNGLIRFWDGGPYSHCELVLSRGVSASATVRDGMQVRSKYINFSDANWDFLDVPPHLEAAAVEFFRKTEGMPYDLIGQFRFILNPYRGSADKYWCSEWVAEALGMPDAWRYGPNGLYAPPPPIKVR